MEFKSWVNDNITEANWKNWFGGFGKKAGRALGFAQPQVTPQKKTVGFSAKYLRGIAEQAQGYINLIDEFARRIRNQTRNPQSQQYIAQSFWQVVGPHYKRLKEWIEWANNMVTQVPQREWSEDLFEGIKVGYKNFENMAKTMQDIVLSMGKWVRGLGAVDELRPYMQRIQNAYDNNVVANSEGLAIAFQSMSNKVKELMGLHGMQYQQNSRPAQSPDLGGYGAKLAGQMQRDQQAAQAAKAAGQGVSALQRNQQSSVNMVPYGRPDPRMSMLNRG